jgi:hypothetical protein
LAVICGKRLSLASNKQRKIPYNDVLLSSWDGLCNSLT